MHVPDLAALLASPIHGLTDSFALAEGVSPTVKPEEPIRAARAADPARLADLAAFLLDALDEVVLDLRFWSAHGPQPFCQSIFA